MANIVQFPNNMLIEEMKTVILYTASPKESRGFKKLLDIINDNPGVDMIMKVVKPEVFANREAEAAFEMQLCRLSEQVAEWNNDCVIIPFFTASSIYL